MSGTTKAVRTLAAVLAAVALLLLASTAVLAQQDGADQAAVAAENSGPEANLPYLFAAYTLTWLGFFAYLYYVSQRQRSLRREVEMLREAMEERDRRERGTE